MTDNREDLFGNLYDAEVAKKMYIARRYVLDELLPCILESGIDSGWKKNFHFMVNSDSPLMLAIVRQLAITMHFLSYDEERDENCTVITVCCANIDVTYENLGRDEYICNLLKYGKVYKHNDIVRGIMYPRFRTGS